MESLPMTVIKEEILLRLDLETLCSVACVCRFLSFSVSQLLPLLSSLHLKTLCPDGQTLIQIMSRCKGVRSISLNCLRLHDSSICHILGPNIQELNLFSCSLLSYQILISIGHNCPNLRVLMLELVDQFSTDTFKRNLIQMLNGCLHLESLCLKIRSILVTKAFQFIEFSLPKTIKILKLQQVFEQDAICLVNKLGVVLEAGDRNLSIPISPLSHGFTLQSLSLVLDVISDELVTIVANCLPLLIELVLEDRPTKEPLPHRDLTDVGVQSLGSCSHLTSLSLVRSRQNHQVSFKRVSDMGMFLLSEGCKCLELVRLCGFSKVSDAGFASILHSCHNLKKFEVRNALDLSDLAFFYDPIGVPCALVEVRLLSCSVTSETVKQLASSRSLEVLDLCGCKSIADSSLNSISCFRKLSALVLSGADITDSGLSVLGQGSLPITRLSLRGCKRVTDKGISLLLCGGGTIGQTLSALDLGHMSRISDKSILTIAAAGKFITELCIRCCFHVTDSSVEALATKRTFQDGSRQLRRLDLYKCIGLSVDSLRWLKKGPLFHGLHWIGVGHTRMTGEGYSVLNEICKERPWLTLCLDGCEMGCQDGWQYHIPESHWS